jgi:hypothetical protein
MKKILLLGLILTLTTFAFAQSDRASITGTVTDQSGAVIAGVEVTATHVATNTATSVNTNGQGLYTILNLPNGQYTLTFTKNGFTKFERKGITLLVSQVASIDAKLSVGATSEVVTVVENASVLQTETAAISTNLTNNVVSELPLNVQGGRNLSNFMFAYVPGVEGGDYDSHILGSVTKSKEVMIDGTSAVAQIGGYLSESQPPMEAVEEFQVTTTGLRADEGRSGGGVFRYNLKSGTNQWHGSGLLFLHNEALDANSYYSKYHQKYDVAAALAKGDTTRASFLNKLYSRPDDRMYDYGASFGGPIVKDKTFFFFAWERYQFANYGLGNMDKTVPTTAFLNGDFSSLIDTRQQIGTDAGGNPIYKGAIIDPATGQPFPGNIIPANRISPISQKIVDIYKEQYQPLAAGFVRNNAMPASQPAPWLRQNEYSIKIDQNISDKHRLAGSFIYALIPRVLADQGGVWAPGSQNGGPFANSYDHNTTAPSIRIIDSYTISPNLLNVATATFNRFHNPSSAVSRQGNWSQTLGLGDFGAGNFPIIKFQGLNGDQHRKAPDGPTPDQGTQVDLDQLGSQFNDFYTANTFIYGDNLSWVHGRHTFKFGAEFRAMQFNSHGDYGVPTFIFDAAQTAGSFGGNAGFGFASFLLGNANQGSVSTPNNTYGRRKTLSLYALDDFKVSSKLTMNFDLRWDFNGRYHEKYGHWSNFNTTLMNPATGKPGALEFAKDGSDSFERKQNYHNFSGSIGAAYQLLPRTVVRGNFGVFYVPLNLNTWGAIPYGFNPGFSQDNRYTSPFQWDSGYPGTPVDVGKDPNFTRWGMVAIDPRSLELGNTQQWSVGVEHELTRDLRLDVSFIQSHSYHLESGYLAGNQPKLADYTAMANSGIMWNWYTSPGFAGPGWATVAPFPTVAATWGPLFWVGPPLGNADYKSLQFSLSKRTSHGLSLQASYNYSVAHGNTDNGFQELWWAGPLQDVYNLQKERQTIAPFDMTHIVKGYINYDLPFGKGKPLLGGVGDGMNALVGGWTISSGFHYNSGTPMRITSSNWYPGINNVYINVTPGCDISQHFNGKVGGQYFNPACFSNPGGYGFGNGPGYFDGLRGPGLATEDIGLNKALAFGEGDRYRLSLRFQMFNAFNRHGFGGPITNPSDPAFGTVTADNLRGNPGPRQGQFGMRFTF